MLVNGALCVSVSIRQYTARPLCSRKISLNTLSRSHYYSHSYKEWLVRCLNCLCSPFHFLQKAPSWPNYASGPLILGWNELRKNETLFKWTDHWSSVLLANGSRDVSKYCYPHLCNKYQTHAMCRQNIIWIPIIAVWAKTITRLSTKVVTRRSENDSTLGRPRSENVNIG